MHGCSTRLLWCECVCPFAINEQGHEGRAGRIGNRGLLKGFII